MKKVTTLVLMLGFILSGALCYANGAARTENEKGKGQILTIHKAQQSITKYAQIVIRMS